MLRTFETGAVRDTGDGKGTYKCVDLSCLDNIDDDVLIGICHVKGNLERDWIEDADQYCRETIKLMFEKCGYNCILHLGKVAQIGAEKYGEYNWQKGIPCSSFIDSAIRHWCKYKQGWEDEDHLGSAVWNLMALHSTLETDPKLNDLYRENTK